MTEKKPEIECGLAGNYGYAHYISGIKLINRLYIRNLSRQDYKDVHLNITCEGLLQPFCKNVTIPYESTVDFDLFDLKINLGLLVNISDKKDFVLRIELIKETSVLCSFEAKVAVLPYYCLSGAETSPELFSCFVNPDNPVIAQILRSASDILFGRKKRPINGGYEEYDARAVKLIAAAIYRALQLKDISYENTAGEHLKTPEEIISSKKASLTDMAAFYLSCLEAANLNCILAKGKDIAICGIWLKDNCFLETSSDDALELKKRSDESINDIAVFDLKGLLSETAVSFSSAENAAKDSFEKIFTVTDIKRCRIAGYKPLPVRIKKENGYELVAPPQKSLDEFPEDIKSNIRQIKMKPRLSKENQWERRLLDLSLKNSLLNFIPHKNMLQVMSVSVKDTASAFFENVEYSLMEMPSEFSDYKAGSFGTQKTIKPLFELIELERKNKRLRTFCSEKDLSAYASALYRKEKMLSEETGTSALAAACGFLKWNNPGEKNNFRYAPLILIPLTMTRKSAGKGYCVKLREDEVQFNTTLAELLKQQFGIEMRGIDSIKSDEVESVLAAVKKQILGFKGWEVTEDVYIASLSFARYLIWNDIRSNMDVFRKNKLVSSLIQGKPDSSLIYPEKQQEKTEIYLPVTADYSQEEAVRLSDNGTSFVLHGPPGTGKSQTITNIIANAVAKNKRVLFVAEKQAALSVVKKRLDKIGIGDFCLELYSDKTVKTEVAKKLFETSQLSLPPSDGYRQKQKQLEDIIAEVKAPFEALHKKRRLGISVYEGILKVKQYENAPDVINIDSLFYEKLTAEKLRLYEDMLSELVSVSKDIKNIYRSPFEYAEICTYDRTFVPRVITASKILREEARHLKTYAEMCFETLCGKLKAVTKKKLQQLKELCETLTKQDNPYKKLFENVKVSGAINILNGFIETYKEFEKAEEKYKALFKNRVDLPESAQILREELEIFPLEFSKSRLLRTLIKRMNKAAKEKIRIENLRECIETVLVYNETKERTANAGENLSKLFSGGRVNYNQVADFILQLDKLYELISQIFPHYDRNSFNLTLENLFTKYPAEIFSGFLSAYDNFERARIRFYSLLMIKKDYDDIGEDYAEFLSIKAASICDNIDLLDGWCRFNALSNKFREEGLKFALSPLYDGKISPQEVSACFYKKVYENFVIREIADDPALSRFTSAITEEKIENLKIILEEFENITCAEIRRLLVSNLPSINTEGPLSVELMQLQRAYKSNMRGISVRGLIASLKNLFRVLAPCVLMSPGAVAKYLPPEEAFDIVVFDEASQIPTAEAVSSLARAKSACIVGDPKQLPPTAFFIADYTDEDNLQLQDLESVLEDCLALGLPERYLQWHYRSKHESLIAFSNALYYGNKLCTFPSPDALISKVQLKFVENGVYDRGVTKTNSAEADSLVAEVVKRLKSGSSQSIGIVTFSAAQQTLIENKLSDALIKNKLESAAYEREEPLFVKNLENVQGDERDVILFSVCYGPDRYGKLSYNFGPLNQLSGWRRLNVAASRAREEMVVFSSMTSAMIDLSKSNLKGVAGIKAFLEFAKSGKTMLAVKASYAEDKPEENIGKYIADDLEEAGYECRRNLGVSYFKIDVAVLDPETKKFILAVITDAKIKNDVKGETVLQIKTLKKLGWNVYRIWTLNYMNNPKREIKKIKQYIDKIKGVCQEKSENKFVKPYKEASLKQENYLSSFITDQKNENEIKKRLLAIIEAEQPVSKGLLIKKCLSSYGIIRTGSRINARIEEILSGLDCRKEEFGGTVFYGENDPGFYRIEENVNIPREAEDISPYEYIAAAKSILLDKISLYVPDLIKEIAAVFRLGRSSETAQTIKNAIEFGNSRGYLTISVNDMVSL
jgi:hypothetical protein